MDIKNKKHEMGGKIMSMLLNSVAKVLRSLRNFAFAGECKISQGNAKHLPQNSKALT